MESNEQNKLTKKIETETWIYGTDYRHQRRGKARSIKVKEYPKNIYARPIDTDNSEVMTIGNMRGVEVGKGQSWW